MIINIILYKYIQKQQLSPTNSMDVEEDVGKKTKYIENVNDINTLSPIMIFNINKDYLNNPSKLRNDLDKNHSKILFFFFFFSLLFEFISIRKFLKNFLEIIKSIFNLMKSLSEIFLLFLFRIKFSPILPR